MATARYASPHKPPGNHKTTKVVPLRSRPPNNTGLTAVPPRNPGVEIALEFSPGRNKQRTPTQKGHAPVLTPRGQFKGEFDLTC